MRKIYKNLNIYPTKQFIESELKRSGLHVVETTNHLQIVCPFHRDSKPSLSICLGFDKIPAGVFYCFGCSEKGSWNKLASRLGLRQWGEEESQGDNIYISRNFQSIKEEIKEDDFVLSKWSLKWRRYTPEFLKKFHVRKMRDCLNHTDYLYVPIDYAGDIYGYCRVRLKTTDLGPKYFFSPNMTKVLYPIDELIKQETPVVVLVEGITDVFRLLNARIPALALLGVNLLPIMQEQLELLDVKTIILCLDGDEPGRRAVTGCKLSTGKWKPGLKEILEDKGFDVVDYKLPEENDPDNAPSEYIRDIRKLVLKCHGVLYEG